MPTIPRRLLQGSAFALTVSFIALVLTPHPAARRAAPTPADFTRVGVLPSGFLLGVATSAHQVEGHMQNDWTLFEARPDMPAAGEAVRHDDPLTLDADLDRARQLGINAYRLSIEWSRVEPRRDVFDDAAITYYAGVIDRIRSRGMEPLVTLHHFTLPQWLLDPSDVAAHPGWTDAATVAAFVDYAGYVAEALGSRVDLWTTLNEPVGQAAGGYVSGAWSPGLTGRWDLFLRGVNNMIRAHRQAFVVIKQRDTADANNDGIAAQVGLVHNLKPVYAARPGTADDQDARDWDYVFHKQFLDAIAPVFDTGEYPVPLTAVASRTPGATCWDSDIDYACDVQPSSTTPFLDFLGVNYHLNGVSIASPLGASNPPLGDRQTDGIRNSVLLSNARYGFPAGEYPAEQFARGPWEIDPAGLLRVLRDVWGRYRLPVIITENGLAESADAGRMCEISKRPAAIVSHVQMVLQAIAEGIPVRGYFHWSLIDNYEWREGYDTRAKFGLYSVRLNAEDRPRMLAGQSTAPTAPRQLDPSVPGYQDRIETPAALAYRHIARNRGVTQHALDRWGSYPRLAGVSSQAGPVRIVQANAPFATPGDARTEYEESVAIPVPAACRVVDASVVLTDANGNVIPQDANYRQGGRIADTRISPLRRVEVRSWTATDDVFNAQVLWSRQGQTVSGQSYLAGFAYRVIARLDCSAFDADGDHVVQACDSCPSIANASQVDLDGDGAGDECDDDDDGDSLTDAQEAVYGTNPRQADSDGDTLADGRDVEFVQSSIAQLPLSAFHAANAAGARTALVGMLDTVEGRLLANDAAGALAALQSVRSRVDGCGAAADATDWIVDCGAQTAVRTAVDLLRVNITSGPAR
jgi:beta-glucosidase